MSDQPPHTPPDLAPGTDVVAPDASAKDVRAGTRDDELTMQTPDELGGVGGDSSGGAG